MLMLTFTTILNNSSQLCQEEASNEAVVPGLAGPLSVLGGWSSKAETIIRVPSCVWVYLRESGFSRQANWSVWMQKRQKSSFITVKQTFIDFAQLRDSTLGLVSPFTLMGSAWINSVTNPTVFISAPSLLLLLLFQSFKAPLSRIKDWRGAEAPQVMATMQSQHRFSSLLTKKLKKAIVLTHFRSHCFDSR